MYRLYGDLLISCEICFYSPSAGNTGTFGFIVFLIKVKASFVNGQLDEEIYIKQFLLKSKEMSPKCANVIHSTYGSNNRIDNELEV